MRIRTLLTFGAGYVLGARAGRERYEQIRGWVEKVAGNERLRMAAETGIGTARNAAAEGLDAASQQLRRLAD